MTRQEAQELHAGCSLILALAELPAVQREAVVGHQMRGDTLDELARRRGVTRAAVSQAEQKGLNRLARLLAPLRDQLAA